MGYLLATAIILNRSSMFNPLMRYFSSQITYLGRKWWRRGTENSATDNIRPYKITFSEKLVEDLKYKLIEFIHFKKQILSKIVYYEKNIIYFSILSKLLHHWAYNYNFMEQEEYINSYPHFMTNIQGLDIHYIHINRCNIQQRSMPVLLLHGWPSSIMEFYEDISRIKFTQSEIIIPSLPGFGFSSAPTISGFSCIEMSVVLKNLMLRLGHDKFRVKDGSYGAINGLIMSTLFPQQCFNDLRMYKQNYIYWRKGYLFTRLTKTIAQIEKNLKGFGSFQHQASEMNTIVTNLNNSPVALAEYFIDDILCTNRINPVLNLTGLNFYMDMIDNLMMYSAPKCINTAMQVYVEQYKNLPNEVTELLKNL